MNKIEKPTMTVLVNGTAEIREVSHIEADEIQELGKPVDVTRTRRFVPVLKEGEAVLHILGGGPPHIVRGYWPEPLRTPLRDFQHQYGQTFTEAQDEND